MPLIKAKPIPWGQIAFGFGLFLMVMVAVILMCCEVRI
jgi:hypothetical protein